MTSNLIYLFIILIASVPIMCHDINKRFFNIFKKKIIIKKITMTIAAMKKL